MDPIKVIVWIEGGCLIGAFSDRQNIKFELIDSDNLKADGITNKEIDLKWEECKKDYPFQIF